jgi:tetratricopeptide (TPR) repeat protein
MIAGVLLAYLPALKGQFIWDDDSWTTRISGLLRDFSGLRAIWFQPTALQQYYPVTGTTFWLDYHLWGLQPLPYHLENILLHALSSLLLWRLLRRLQVPGAWLAASLFAVHPLMVESTAWVTERKNVLSLFLFLGALLAYGRFSSFWPPSPEDAPNPEQQVPRSSFAYASALALFLAALLAKTTAFCLPAVLLLIAWWKSGRLRWRIDILPAIPFFSLSIIVGTFTTWLERHHVGAQGVDWTLSFAERCQIAGRAFWFYLGKLVWPANLCFVYPRWHLDPGSALLWIFPLTAACLLIALWLARSRLGRGPAAAAFYFVGSLAPLLGFMNAYFMRYSFVCDHWVYLSSIGPITLAASSLVCVSERLRLPAIPVAFATVVIPVLAFLTWRQTAQFRDSEALWRATLEKNPDAWMACDALGNILADKGSETEAMACFQKALSLKATDEIALAAIGNVLFRNGRFQDSIAIYRQSLDAMPNYVPAHYNLANALARTGASDEAVAHFQTALALQPDCAPAHLGWANVLRTAGRSDEALAHYKQALELVPTYVYALNDLGNLLLERGETDAAISHYQQVLSLKPNHAEAHNNLGVALFHQGRALDALSHWQQSLNSNPAYVPALKNLAWILATHCEDAIRNGPKAVTLALEANRLSKSNSPAVLQILAAAYAENRQFTQALDAAQHGLELSKSGNGPQAEVLLQQIALYRNGKPFHESCETNPPSVLRTR